LTGFTSDQHYLFANDGFVLVDSFSGAEGENKKVAFEGHFSRMKKEVYFLA
jgi:hypothetical protein